MDAHYFRHRKLIACSVPCGKVIKLSLAICVSRTSAKVTEQKLPTLGLVVCPNFGCACGKEIISFVLSISVSLSQSVCLLSLSVCLSVCLPPPSPSVFLVRGMGGGEGISCSPDITCVASVCLSFSPLSFTPPPPPPPPPPPSLSVSLSPLPPPFYLSKCLVTLVNIALFPFERRRWPLFVQMFYMFFL